MWQRLPRCATAALDRPAYRMSGRSAVDEAAALRRRSIDKRAIRGSAPARGTDEAIVKVRSKATLVEFVADAESGRLPDIDIPVNAPSMGSSVG